MDELETARGESVAKQQVIEITCEEVLLQVSNYLDGGVTRSLRARMLEHFRNCDHCTAILNGTRNVVKLIGDGRSFSVPTSKSKRFYQKLNDYLAAKRPRGRTKKA